MLQGRQYIEPLSAILLVIAEKAVSVRNAHGYAVADVISLEFGKEKMPEVDEPRAPGYRGKWWEERANLRNRGGVTA